MGEFVHAGKNFRTLRKAYETRPSLHEKASFLAENLPGAATLGEMTADAETIEQFQATNAAILNSRTKIPGLNFQIGFQPQSNFDRVSRSWYSNSPLLTGADIDTSDRLTVKSGAIAYLPFQCRRTTGGDPVEFHVPLVTFPQDQRDGEPFFIEVKWNKLGLEQVDQEIADRYRNNVDFKHRQIRRPQGIFEKLHAAEDPDPRLGLQDEIVAGPVHPPGKMLAEVAPLATHFERDGSEKMLATQGIIRLDITGQMHKNVARHRNVVQTANQKGTVVTNSTHCSGSSCVHTVHRILFDGTSDEIPPNLPLHEVLFALVGKATKLLWTDEKTRSFYDFLDEPAAFQEISQADFTAKITQLLDYETMKVGHKGMPAFNTTYCMGNTPHPDPDAAHLYNEAAKISLALLEEKRVKLEDGT